MDAGELTPLDARTFSDRNSVALPDTTRKPYEWIADYIHSIAGLRQPAVIDYAFITHFHDDHFGAWYPWAPTCLPTRVSRGTW